MSQTLDKNMWAAALEGLIKKNELSDESIVELALLTWDNFPNQTALSTQIFQKCSQNSESR